MLAFNSMFDFTVDR